MLSQVLVRGRRAPSRQPLFLTLPVLAHRLATFTWSPHTQVSYKCITGELYYFYDCLLHVTVSIYKSSLPLRSSHFSLPRPHLPSSPSQVSYKYVNGEVH